MSLVLENGVSVKASSSTLELRLIHCRQTRKWYQIRHADDDGCEPASLKRGCVVVNFFGTFVCDPIKGITDGEEINISEWTFED